MSKQNLKGNRSKIYKQTNRETIISIVLTVLYFIWWYGFAYGLGLKPVESYSYIMGLPAWFFYSCVLGFIIFSFLTWIVVDKLFKEVSLEKVVQNGKEKDN
jgi:uncharacterized membrane protein YhdT